MWRSKRSPIVGFKCVRRIFVKVATLVTVRADIHILFNDRQEFEVDTENVATDQIMINSSVESVSAAKLSQTSLPNNL